MTDVYQLPHELPEPKDDGAADHLAGRAMPRLTLPSTSGERIALDEFGTGRTVLYLYPMTGRPGVDLPDGWDSIPGARGCTPESCGFRDHHADLLAAGASRVFGLSSQDTDYQQEMAGRLGLPYAVLSDTELSLADELRLPTFHAGGSRLFTRLTMVIDNATITHAFYPVFPPDQHAGEVLAWLQAHPAPAA